MRNLLVCVFLAAAVAAYPISAQDQPASPPQGQPVADTTASLFEVMPNQLEIGGRLTGVDGDPARFQRYADFRDGLLFDTARYTREHPSGSRFFSAGADNVGWRDQRYVARYQQTGQFVISGFWDQIPQFYSVDTRTPYVISGDALTLDDATQRAIQTGQATTAAYVPLAPQFELRERRDTGVVQATITPTTRLDLTAGFVTSRHVGELPWGASFGFSNDVEVALPYDSRTNDVNGGGEWTDGRSMLRLAYDGSWFDNLDDTLIWDSPLRLDDSTTAPGRGRMALWPSNSAHTFTATGYRKFARRTQLTGALSFGTRSNDEPLQPFTINGTLPQLVLPRATAEAQARVVAGNLNFVSRPSNTWSFGARVRHYGYDNQIPLTPIPEFINYDTSIKTSSTGGPEPYAHSRTAVGADATFTGAAPVAITFGYTHNASSHDFRIFENTGEHVLTASADTVGSQWFTFRARYEFADRTGSELNEDLLVQIGEQPQMRHFDIANRTRHRWTGQLDLTPTEAWSFSTTIGAGTDDFDDSYFGLQDSSFLVFSVAADGRLPRGFLGGVSYNHERYDGLQRSRSANPGQENDPTRDWTVDSEENVDYVSLYLTPPRMGRTETRLSYDYSFAEGRYFYAVVPGGPLTPPNQLPNVFNKLQQLHVDVRHRLTSRFAATFAYLYEPFRVFDFALDPTVVNGIVQPSSLVLGYVYRPYTAHSAVVGLKYLW